MYVHRTLCTVLALLPTTCHVHTNGRANLDANGLVARLECVLGGDDIPGKVELHCHQILVLQLADEISYESVDITMEEYRVCTNCLIGRLREELNTAQQHQECPISPARGDGLRCRGSGDSESTAATVHHEQGLMS